MVTVVRGSGIGPPLEKFKLRSIDEKLGIQLPPEEVTGGAGLPITGIMGPAIGAAIPGGGIGGLGAMVRGPGRGNWGITGGIPI